MGREFIISLEGVRYTTDRWSKYPYPLHIVYRIPYLWYFDPLIMIYLSPSQWYIEPTYSPWYFDPHIHGTYKRVSIFHGWGLNIPWVAGQNTLGRGLDIP
jgi:hypothetical protein